MRVFNKNKFFVVVSMVFFTTGCQSMMHGMGMLPMGSSEDIADSKVLWDVLEQEQLVGENSKKVKPYTGQHPHGAILEMLHKKVTVNGHTGLAIIKRNYGGKGVSIENVSQDRKKYLKAVTVMFQRESGYDSDNKDWFWAKYTPGGGLHVKKKMMLEIGLAGRVAKGKPEGCISCHVGAPGGDLIWAEDIEL